MKQWDMSKRIADERLRFMIGDVRDRARLERAMRGTDYVVHAAAQKIVPIAEYNPFECVKTNVMGAMNVIDSAIDTGVKKVVALSTDKASAPSNLYGATKLCSDKLFVSGNAYSSIGGTSFSVVRYGNVMGSRGSVIPFFLSIKDNVFPITDPRMTRFMISLDQGIDLVNRAFDEMRGGEIFVKKIPSMNILDIAKSVRPNAEMKIVGIRPGEKLHETMVSSEDSYFTYEWDSYYKILPVEESWSEDMENALVGGKKVEEGFVYSSETNTDWMSSDVLKKWIMENYPERKLK